MPGLYLLRHGIAEPAGSDPALSEEGVMLMEGEALGMTRLGLRFDAILTSPLRRAEQTARVVARTLGIVGKVETSRALAPGCRLSGLSALFDAHRAARAILLVGHQPDMGRIAAELTGALDPPPLEKGTLCCLEVAGWPPRPPATLERVLSPGFLRGQAAPR